jgi:hypothetical protein
MKCNVDIEDDKKQSRVPAGLTEKDPGAFYARLSFSLFSL